MVPERLLLSLKASLNLMLLYQSFLHVSSWGLVVISMIPKSSTFQMHKLFFFLFSNVIHTIYTKFVELSMKFTWLCSRSVVASLMQVITVNWKTVTASNLKNAIVIFCIFLHFHTGKLLRVNSPFRKTSLLMIFHESNT